MSQYDKIIELPSRGGVIQFREFLDFRRHLAKLKKPSYVLLDLGGVRFAHPSGMAPIVAVIRDLADQGWTFDVGLPTQEFIADYFHKAGWIDGITGEISTSAVSIPGSSFIPLTHYRNHNELNPILDEALRHFTQHSVYQTGVLEGIEWALNEIADNVLIHAGGVGGWLQLAEQPKKGLMEIVVVDCGQGICSSLHERYPELQSDMDALSKAVEKGVTRNPDIGQGNGLAGTLRIAIGAKGWVNLCSGKGILRYSPESAGNSDRGIGRAPTKAAYGLKLESGPAHQGTVVTLTIPTSQPLDVAGALWGHRPMSTFESQYVQDSGREVRFIVAEEATGFGNRDSARPLRQRLHNLFNLYPDMRVIVDFEGVNLVSASFADEFIARLAKQTGVASFFQRIVLVNTNDLVRRTLDAVLEQRLGT